MSFTPNIVLLGEPVVRDLFCESVGVDPIKNYLQISVKGVRYSVYFKQFSLSDLKTNTSSKHSNRNLEEWTGGGSSAGVGCDSLANSPHGVVILFDADEFASQFYLPSVLDGVFAKHCCVDTLLLGSCVSSESQAVAWEPTLKAVNELLPVSHKHLVTRGQPDLYKQYFSSFLKYVIECNTDANLGSFKWEWQKQIAKNKKFTVCNLL